MSSSPAVLSFYSGSLRGRSVSLSGGQSRIGRGPGCEIQLNPDRDPTISTLHARVEFENNRWYVTDLGSRSGTYLSGTRLIPNDRTPVAFGTWILFGTGGALARLEGPNPVIKQGVVALESEASPGDFVVVENRPKVVATLGTEGRIKLHTDGSMPKNGFRIHIDRQPPVVETREGEAEIKAGQIVRADSESRGIRILAAQPLPLVKHGPGTKTMQRIVDEAVGRRSRVLWLALACAAAMLMVGGVIVFLVIKKQTDQHDREIAFKDAQARAKEERLRNSLDAIIAESEERQKNLEKRIEEVTKKPEKEEERIKFQKILEAAHESVLLIRVDVTFYDSAGRKNGNMGGYGTGFIATTDGKVISNKHVIEPWKFNTRIQEYLLKNPGTKIRSKIYAWHTGQKFGSSLLPNRAQGYNNDTLANLSLVRTFPDTWVSGYFTDTRGRFRARMHKHNNNDLALLQLTGGPFKPLAVKSEMTKLKALDPVMLLGFPLGARVLESGKADLSATLGTIRFTEPVIAHTASAFPGNSGGPLLTLDGEVIGVLTRADEAGMETFTKAIRAESVHRLLK